MSEQHKVIYNCQEYYILKKDELSNDFMLVKSPVEKQEPKRVIECFTAKSDGAAIKYGIHSARKYGLKGGIILSLKKSRLRIISHTDGQRPKSMFALIFSSLVALIVFSTVNSFVRLPLGIPIAFLTVIAGISLIGLIFLGIFQKSGIDNRFLPAQAKSFRVLLLKWIACVVCIIMGYSSLYTEIFTRSADSFVGVLGGISSIYFSVVTLATVGYGDIHPVSSLARLLVVSEILIPIVLLPILLAISIFWVINRNRDLKTETEVKPRNPYIRVK